RRLAEVDARPRVHRRTTISLYRLTPAKSLTLRLLVIPDKYFADFFRGCVNGDGSVVVYTDRYHTAKKPRYVYERLDVSLVSASRPFLEWAQDSVLRIAQVRGTINVRSKTGPNRLGAAVRQGGIDSSPALDV